MTRSETCNASRTTTGFSHGPALVESRKATIIKEARATEILVCILRVENSEVDGQSKIDKKQKKTKKHPETSDRLSDIRD